MDPIEYLILITVAMSIFEILLVVYSFLNFFILTPIFGNKGIFLPTEWGNFISGIASQIAAIILPFYIFIILFYIIMYIIYLIIIYIIPPTGFATLFIPIREMLLLIPPLPSLIKYGVFRLFDKIIESLGLSGFLLKIVSIIGALFDFSRANIKQVLLLIFPGMDNVINELEKKEEKPKEKPKEEPKEKKSEIHKQIEQDKNICVAYNTKPITPDMTTSEKMKINYSNINETIKCESQSIGNYIKGNN